MIFMDRHQAKAEVQSMMKAIRQHGSYIVYYNDEFAKPPMPFVTTIPCEPFDAFVTAHELLHQAKTLGKNVYIVNSDGKCIHSSVRSL